MNRPVIVANMGRQYRLIITKTGWRNLVGQTHFYHTSTHSSVHVGDAGIKELRITANVLPSPYNATICVGFHREWEFHQCENLRILTTLSRIWAGRHAKGPLCEHSRAGNRLYLLPVQYVPSLPRRHPVTTTTAFSFSDGVETPPDAGLPSSVESFFDLEDCDLDRDFDCPGEGDPVESQAETSPDISERQQKSIKAYLVKCTAYRTLGGDSYQIYHTTNG